MPGETKTFPLAVRNGLYLPSRWGDRLLPHPQPTTPFIGFTQLKMLAKSLSESRVIWVTDSTQGSFKFICVLFSHHRPFTEHNLQNCLKIINIVTSRRVETTEKCERFTSPRFVTTKHPVPRHRDGRRVFNPFSELPLLAVLAKQCHFNNTLNSAIFIFKITLTPTLDGTEMEFV